MEKAFQMTEEIYLNENLMNYLGMLKNLASGIYWFTSIVMMMQG